MPQGAVAPAPNPSGAATAQYPYLHFIDYWYNGGRSNYNSLQATLTKRLSHGFSFTAGYTYGHGLDNGSLNRFAGLVQNSLRPGAEYASSDFDVRHRATFTASYEIPGPKGFGQLLRGWKLNSIITLTGSMPWNVVDSADNFSGTNEYTDRWDFFGNPSDFKSQGTQSLPYCTGPGEGGCSVTSGVSGIQSFFTAAQSTAMWAQCTAVAPDPSTLNAAGCYVKGKSVMVPPLNGTFGTMGRNIFRDTGFKNVDFSVFKTFTFKERLNATFRAEFFNVLNHPIIANPFGSVTGGTNGSDPSSGSQLRLRVPHARPLCRQPDRGFGRRPPDPTRVEVDLLSQRAQREDFQRQGGPGMQEAPR